MNLTDKEIVELRIKLLEPIFITASKASLEKHQVFEIAEQAWAYAIKPLVENRAETPYYGTGPYSKTVLDKKQP